MRRRTFGCVGVVWNRTGHPATGHLDTGQTKCNPPGHDIGRWNRARTCLGGGPNTQALITIHPSAILRMPDDAREAGYADLAVAAKAVR